MKKVFPILYFVLLSCQVSGQVLYKCVSHNGDTTTWLLGTCHYIDQQLFNFDPVIDSILQRCEIVFVEPFIDDGTPGYTRQRTALIKATRYPGNKKLADYITTKELQQVRSFYRHEYQVSDNEFASRSNVIPLLMHTRLIFAADSNIVRQDLLIIEHALKYKKKIVRLDNFDALVKTYRWMGQHYDARWLVQQINLSPVDNLLYRQGIRILINAYLNQDTTQIKLQMQKEEAGNKIIVGQRNAHWEKLIKEKSSTGNFLECGIAHLLYPEKGLLDFFKRQGYTITQVPVKLKNP